MQDLGQFLPVVRRKSPRTTVYAIGRVVDAVDAGETTCPVCGAPILVVAFEEAEGSQTRVSVVPYDPAPEREPVTRFDDLLPTPHAWTCRRDNPEDW
jgi:hypothetical protein